MVSDSDSVWCHLGIGDGPLFLMEVVCFSVSIFLLRFLLILCKNEHNTIKYNKELPSEPVYIKMVTSTQIKKGWVVNQCPIESSTANMRSCTKVINY